MWLLKFRVFDEKNRLRRLLEKTDVKIYYYPITHYVENHRYFFVAVGVVEGEENKVKSFFRGLKKLKKAKTGRRLDYIQTDGRFFVIITSHSSSEEIKTFVHVFYNPKIIHLKPVIFTASGEEAEMVALERKDLEKIIEVGSRIYKIKILKFKQEKIKNFGFLTVLPELTEKQEKALKLALEYGYYNYPRKISLDRLSKIAKLSFSTFQAHIRKAENKIISFVLSLKK